MTMVKMTDKLRLALLAGLVIILAASCDPARKYEKEENEKIQKYLNSHPALDFVKQKSGLFYFEITAGTGNQVETGDSVYFDYILQLLDGQELADTNFYCKVGIGELIPGVDEGMLKMKDGGNSKLLVPSFLGYGNTGMYFPAWTPLLFDITITKHVAASGK
jgi:FKBP-type peptidyl-prolyl cis-trans isomerase FkpA